MIAPRYILKANSDDVHHTNPGWLVLFVSFVNPASMFSNPNIPLMAIKDIKTTIVENDCISININRPKNSFAKTCQLVLKVTDTVWQHTVAPGDWVFVWISNDKNHIDKLGNILRNEPPSSFKNRLCNWNSGLKFVGRVINVSLNYTTTAIGLKSVTQTVSCQAFIEFATSVYYTYDSFNSPNPKQETPSGQITNIEVGDDVTTGTQASLAQGFVTDKLQLFTKQFDDKKSKLRRFYVNFAEKFLEIVKTNPVISPDVMIQNLLIILWGITRNNQTAEDIRNASSNAVNTKDKQSNLSNNVTVKNVGQFSDAIRIPSIVGYILDRPGAVLLHEIYNVILGVQRYNASSNSSSIWEAFFPVLKATNNSAMQYSKFTVFWAIEGANNRCKGVCPFTPPLWSNETIWSILSQFLNPVVNEMYTALRVDLFNRINPTLVVREIPFSTGLQPILRNNLSALFSPAVLEMKSKVQSFVKNKGEANLKNKLSTLQPNTQLNNKKTHKKHENQAKDKSKDKFLENENISKSPETVTYFGNLPRWVLTPEIVQSVNVGTSEANRINLVQVWGQSSFVDFLNINFSAQQFREQQAVQGNAVADLDDIARHGLRADIQSTQFDFVFDPTSGKTRFFAPIWAAMRADWFFNGHLKLFGSISTVGITEPICEGDNLEFDGYVYHIDGVSFQAGIQSSGVKFFNTVLSLSNGLSAERLHSNFVPSYASDKPALRESANLPGMTLVQRILNADYKNEDSDP